MAKDKKMLLIFPPQWTPIAPHFAMASLMGQLLNKGYKATALDLNIEFYNKILTKSYIDFIIQKIKKDYVELFNSVKKIISKDKTANDYTLQEQCDIYKFTKLKEFNSKENKFLDTTPSLLPFAIQVIRDKEKFFTPEYLIKAMNVIDNALKLVSLAYCPTTITFDSCYNQFMKFNYESFEHFVFDKKSNPYWDFLKEKVEEIKKEKEAQEYKEKLVRKKAQQKADSIWNAIPLKKYSGPFQLTANVSAKEGYATYFYREEKGQRVYEKGFNYQDNSIMISGEYKKGMKHGRWTYHLKEPNLKLEVDYKNGIRNGMYKCIVHNENGKQTLNMTLKMENNFVVGIANFWKSWMFFNYKPRIEIKNAQIKATFSVDGRLDEISEITTTGSDAGRFKYCERWSFGSLLEKYYYNNMTGDRIDLERTSPIVDTIRELINEIFALTENKMPKGFNEDSNAQARKLYYFHINWKLSEQGRTTAPEWDQNSRNYFDTMNFN